MTPYRTRAVQPWRRLLPGTCREWAHLRVSRSRVTQRGTGSLLQKKANIGTSPCLIPHRGSSQHRPTRSASGRSPRHQPTQRGVPHVPVTPPHGRVTRPSGPTAVRAAAVTPGAVHRRTGTSVTPQPTAGRPPAHLAPQGVGRGPGLAPGRGRSAAGGATIAEKTQPERPWGERLEKRVEPQRRKTRRTGADVALVRRDRDDATAVRMRDESGGTGRSERVDRHVVLELAAALL